MYKASIPGSSESLLGHPTRLSDRPDRRNLTITRIARSWRTSVVTIARPAHAPRDAVHRQAILIVVTRVRRPPIGMMQQPGLGTAAIERHRERGEGQMATIQRADRQPT